MTKAQLRKFRRWLKQDIAKVNSLGLDQATTSIHMINSTGAILESKWPNGDVQRHRYLLTSSGYAYMGSTRIVSAS